MIPYPGQMWTKTTSGRQAQVSGMDKDFVYMYWPDRDAQTRVRRPLRRREWQPVPDYATWTWRPLRTDC